MRHLKTRTLSLVIGTLSMATKATPKYNTNGHRTYSVKGTINVNFFIFNTKYIQ